jgi:hypothetical protein
MYFKTHMGFGKADESLCADDGAERRNIHYIAAETFLLFSVVVDSESGGCYSLVKLHSQI